MTSISSGASTTTDTGEKESAVFANVQQHTHKHFQFAIQTPNSMALKALFTTDAAGLFDNFIANLPDEEQQNHRCNCCRHFIERFGHLVMINDDGTLSSAMWGIDAPAPYTAAVAAMAKMAEKAKVTGVFLTNDTVWGSPVANDWHHFYIKPLPSMLYGNRAKEPHAAMALKREDFKTLVLAFKDFKEATIKTALQMLKAESFENSEHFVAQTQFLLDVALMRNDSKGRYRDNLTWLAVARAAPGWCTPRSSMVGNLLEDLNSTMSMAVIKKRFNDKVHPLRFKRPQAAPTTGNIKRAEEIFAKLGLAPALDRRYAKLEDLQLLWSPTEKAEAAPAGGVFGHLAPKANVPTPRMAVQMQAITWSKFLRTVLSEAQRIKAYMPTGSGNFIGLLTAANPEAPPILQWDSVEQRNPVSWYVYPKGSAPGHWGLTPGDWVKVTGITEQPSMWNGNRHPHHGQSVIFLLKDAIDTRIDGAGLFPDILKADLHEVRATIEAHSKFARPAGAKEATANGLRVGSEQTPVRVRVTSALGVAEYVIDRWE